MQYYCMAAGPLRAFTSIYLQGTVVERYFRTDYQEARVKYQTQLRIIQKYK